MKHVLRRLRRSPGFTAVALLTLAAGIGANTAIFSIVNGVLLKPLPYPESDRLISVVHEAPGVNMADAGSSPYLYFTEREENETFEGVGLWGTSSASVTGAGEPEQIRALDATFEILPLLGIRPLLGRVFAERDDSPGAARTVVLTYGYWQSRFGADESVIGQSLVVDGEPHEIIGVMPESFRFLDEQVDLISPYRLDRDAAIIGDYGWASLARLKPGVTLEEASADVARMIPIAIDGFPPFPGTSRQQARNARLGPSLRPLKQDVVGDVGDMLWLLMGTIGIVLLVACANVANLQLVRAEGRQQEIAIRSAIGASFRHIAGELLLESLALAVIGGLLGLALAYGGLELLLAFGPQNLPRLGEIAIDPAVLGFALAVSLFSGVLLGLIPASKYARARPATGLRAGRLQSRERHRARGALVVVQIALVLLIDAGLMVRTFEALADVEPGFARPDDVLTFSIDVPPAHVPEAENVTRLQDAILDEIAAISGVTSVAFASSPPMGGDTASDLLVPEGRVFVEGDRPQPTRFKFVSPGFFETSGTPILVGRDLTWTDTYERRPVALVSASLARLEWGDPREALGNRLRGGSAADEWREIVGVVGDVLDDGVAETAPEIVYVPALLDRFWTNPTLAWRSVTYLVRSPRTGTPAFLDEIRETVRAVDPSLPLANVRTLGEIYDRSLARTSLTLVLLSIAGAMALLLGIVGIYGLVSYAVSQSTHEIGIRIALGARSPAIRRAFVRRALALAAVGIVFGLGAAAGLSRLMSSLLFGVGALDPLTYTAVGVVLVLAVVLASYVPARRATRVDPLEAIRAE